MSGWWYFVALFYCWLAGALWGAWVEEGESKAGSFVRSTLWGVALPIELMRIGFRRLQRGVTVGSFAWQVPSGERHRDFVELTEHVTMNPTRPGEELRFPWKHIGWGFFRTRKHFGWVQKEAPDD